jgi:hypothetical protein
MSGRRAELRGPDILNPARHRPRASSAVAPVLVATLGAGDHRRQGGRSAGPCRRTTTSASPGLHRRPPGKPTRDGTFAEGGRHAGHPHWICAHRACSPRVSRVPGSGARPTGAPGFAVRFRGRPGEMSGLVPAPPRRCTPSTHPPARRRRQPQPGRQRERRLQGAAGAGAGQGEHGAAWGGGGVRGAGVGRAARDPPPTAPAPVALTA